MGIFDAPEKTHEEVVKDKAREVAKQSARLYGLVNDIHKQIFEKCWCDTEATPQEIFDTLPPQTKQFLFALSGGLQQVLASNPEYVPLVPPFFYSFDEAGNIVIGEVNPDGYKKNEEIV